MSNFLLLTEEQERELYRLSRFYRKEAQRCEKAGAYLAGCVMLGSALETLLMLMVNCYAEEAMATGCVPKRNPRPLVDWTLGPLL